MLFDIAKLVMELKRIAEEIRALKKVHRDPARQPPQLIVYSQLSTMKHRATMLCALRAHTRKRVHHKGSTLEAQEKLVAELVPEFELHVVDEAA